jgi:F-type H+-transporting ATPase subunit b
MESLGINLSSLIAQVFNFLIVMFVLWKFAYNPVLKMLNDRQQKIEKGLADAEAAAKSREKAESEAEKIREKAFKEANEILKNAKEAANAETAILIKKASDQADRIMKTAKAESKAEKEKIMTEAKKEISDVVIIALDKIVSEELTAEQKSKLTAKAISEL